jgi:small subunit ribosomal protein S15
MVYSEKKKQVITQHQQHARDTGSSEVQVALLTTRITDLTEHLKTHKQDFHSRQGLFKMVGTRRRLLSFLEKTNPDSYAKLLKKLKIRK